MDYKDYKNSRDLAWKVLINENIRELPIMVGTLCTKMGIQVRYYTPEDGNDGFSTIIDGRAWIFLSEKIPTKRQRFTAAHELGHILLGHVGHYELVNREPDPKDNPVEQAANVFASRLLAPACVLWSLNARTADEISELCQISRQAAAFRAERMAVLYERGKFLASPLEQTVYKQFSDYIKRRKSNIV